MFLKQKIFRFINFKIISILVFIYSLFSDFFYQVEMGEFGGTKLLSGSDFLFYGWTINKHAFITCLSSWIYLFLILFNKKIPVIKILLSIVMIFFANHIFAIHDYHDYYGKSHMYLKLYHKNGIYIWLTSLFLMALHVTIKEILFFYNHIKTYSK